MRWRGLLGLLGMLAVAAPAQAEWLEAKSRHFVLYADASEQIIRRQAEALERLDNGLRRFMSVAEEPEIASRKVTVFMVPERDIGGLCRCSNVSGFYLSNVSGSLAFSGKGGWTGSSSSRMVLFHEYAHHFLLGSFDMAFPSWYSEGFAEFASTMRIGADAVTIGHAAQHRAFGLHLSNALPLEQMFNPAFSANSGNSILSEIYYARGWLMTHYVSFNADRRAQFVKYLTSMNSGTPAQKAASAAFGDLAALNTDVNAYLHRKTIPGLNIPFGNAPAPAVTVRKVSRGEAALMDMRMTSLRGVDLAEAEKIYSKAAPIAERYYDDAIAQGWFAEIAFDAGHLDTAEASAKRAIALDPRSVQGLLYRARVQLRWLQDAKVTEAADWDDARTSIIAANRADPDDAEPLWWFWRSFELEGRNPTPSAFKGLYRAQELAPQDEEVRFAAAVARIEAGEVTQAKKLLRPLAYHPHAPADNPASQMMAALDEGKAGKEVVDIGAAAAKAQSDKVAAAEAKAGEKKKGAK